MRWVEVRVGCRSYAREAFEERRARGVEELVGDAEDAALADGAQVVPVALAYDSFQRDTVSGSAPGKEEDVGVGLSDCFGGGVSAGFAEVLPSCGFNQLSDPMLRVDERFAPLFAVDEGCLGAMGGLPTGGLDR